MVKQDFNTSPREYCRILTEESGSAILKKHTKRVTLTEVSI